MSGSSFLVREVHLQFLSLLAQEDLSGYVVFASEQLESRMRQIYQPLF
jgi:hypothetical protein